MDRFVLEEPPMGRGGFSNVYRATCRDYPSSVAVKVISTEKPERRMLLAREVGLQKRLPQHPNLVTLLETFTDGPRLMIVMELCEMSLAAFMRPRNKPRVPLSERQARSWLRQIVNGMKVLFDANIAHRDLKPENILLSKMGGELVPKIADFGFAKPYDRGEGLKTSLGTPLYEAPELYLCAGQTYGPQVDLWSLGAIAFEMLEAKFAVPVPKMAILTFMMRLEGGLELLTSSLSAEAHDFVRKLLRKDPSERMRFEELFSHPFLAPCVRVIQLWSKDGQCVEQRQLEFDLIAFFKRGLLDSKDLVFGPEVQLRRLLTEEQCSDEGLARLMVLASDLRHLCVCSCVGVSIVQTLNARKRRELHRSAKKLAGRWRDARVAIDRQLASALDPGASQAAKEADALFTAESLRALEASLLPELTDVSPVKKCPGGLCEALSGLIDAAKSVSLTAAAAETTTAQSPEPGRHPMSALWRRARDMLVTLGGRTHWSRLAHVNAAVRSAAASEAALPLRCQRTVRGLEGVADAAQALAAALGSPEGAASASSSLGDTQASAFKVHTRGEPGFRNKENACNTVAAKPEGPGAASGSLKRRSANEALGQPPSKRAAVAGAGAAAKPAGGRAPASGSRTRIPTPRKPVQRDSILNHLPNAGAARTTTARVATTATRQAGTTTMTTRAAAAAARRAAASTTYSSTTTAAARGRLTATKTTAPAAPAGPTLLSLQDQFVQFNTRVLAKLEELSSKEESTGTAMSAADKARLELLQQENSAIMTEMFQSHAREQTLRTRVEEATRELDTLRVREKELSELAEAREESVRLAESREAEAQRTATEMGELAEQRATEIEELKSTVAQLRSRIADLEAKAMRDERLRRRLHNEVQELKGNIRVFCRVRPPIGQEATGDGVFVFDEADPRKLEVRDPTSQSLVGDGQVKRYTFEYDNVFGPKSTQDHIFEELSQLVQSVLDGYNATIFAYGQTGSGKTYTMEGPQGVTSGPHRGMIPRAIEQIFRSTEELRAQHWEYSLDVSFLEVYNENLRDLLAPTAPALGSSTRFGMTTPAPSTVPSIKYESGKAHVVDARVVRVSTITQVHELLAIATKNRAVAATKANDYSSRSHSVFQMRVTGGNSQTGERVEALLSLVDLAGSERMAQSGVVGDRAKEAQSINKSLSQLRGVILALVNKQSHVPYRDSVLTQVLQSSLGGDSKTLMFVNVNPAVANISQSIASLRFASQANTCHLGTVRKQVSKE
eukprot:m51a1_g3965 putative kinesin-like protein c (1244) ;mRNA; f:378787-384242